MRPWTLNNASYIRASKDSRMWTLAWSCVPPSSAARWHHLNAAVDYPAPYPRFGAGGLDTEDQAMLVTVFAWSGLCGGLFATTPDKALH